MRERMLRNARMVWLVGLWIVSAVGLVRAEDTGFVAAWRTLGKQTAEELAVLAQECHKAKLYGWRNEAYERLLLFDSDHAKARKWLKFRRGADGAWKRGTYLPPKNMKTPSEEVVRKRKAVYGRFADRALEAMKTHESTLLPARRQEVLRMLARFAPDREDLRTALGEVQRADGRWILQESVGAAERRALLARTARKALARIPEARPDRPTKTDNRLRLGWTAIYKAPHVRLMGTVTKAELMAAVKRVEACYPTFVAVFGGKEPKTKPMAIYVLAGSSDKEAVLENHPAATDGYRAWAKSLQSSWFPKTSDIFIYAQDKPLRLEWCSRQVMGNLLWKRFKIRGSPGWAFEGCGLYLSNLVALQRRTFFVKRTQYGAKGTRQNDLWDRLRKVDTDWRKEARDLLASPQAPDLRLLLGKKLNAMNTEDMLASFALCAYLIEGRPEETPKLLEAIGRERRKSIDVLTAAGLDPETLVLKVRRWLKETR